jgi:hypothetical protein
METALKEPPMAQATAIIALSERLRKQSDKSRNRDTIADLRLAACYLRALAVLKIAEEAEVTEAAVGTGSRAPAHSSPPGN